MKFGISVGLPIWHSVLADTDIVFPYWQNRLSADTDTYRLSVRTLSLVVNFAIVVVDDKSRLSHISRPFHFSKFGSNTFME